VSRPHRPGRPPAQRRVWSPRPGWTGSSEDRALPREVEAIVRVLIEQGPLDPKALRERTEARFWGPGRFKAALAEGQRRGRVMRVDRRTYAAAEAPQGRRDA
jgi:hypothetical protein